VKALSVTGVYDTDLQTPATKLEVGEEGWAHCTAIDVQLAGSSDG